LNLVANDAESLKSSKYLPLSAQYRLVPIAVETLGAPGDDEAFAFSGLGTALRATAAEPRSFRFLMQRVSVAVQRENTACFVGAVPPSVD